MKDLDLLGPDADGAHLTLADADGRRYRLRITDSLRASLRPGRRPVGPAVPGAAKASAGSMRPKEIQSLLRAGVPAREVAERAGADLARIKSYAAPIEAERAYIAQRAQGLRVGHVSDAPNLGDLVLDRLASRNVAARDVEWDAVRRDGRPWEVVVTFPVADVVREARWSVDLARHVLQATDDESRWLSETDFDAGSRRRPLPGTGIFTGREGDAQQEAAEDREALLARLASSRGTRQEVADPDVMDPDEAAALESLGARLREDPPGAESDGWHDLPGAHPAHSHAHEAPDAAVLSLAERQHRLATPPTPQEPPHEDLEEPRTAILADEPEADPALEVTEAEAAERAPDAAEDEEAGDGSSETLDVDVPSVPAKRKGSRRSVPSWDEIVFGTRAD